MLLFLFLIAAVVVHISLQYVVIPRLELKRKPLSRSALLAVCKCLSTTALLVSVTYLLILLLMFVLSWTQPVTSGELGAVIARIQAFQSRFKLFREFWMLWLFVMLFLALLAIRHAPAPDKERVPEEPPYLPPNEEMEAITRRIDELTQKLRRVEHGWVGTDSELRLRLSKLRLERDGLQRELHNADLRCRAAASTLAEKALPFHSKVRRFVTSQGFFQTLKATTRSLSYIGTVLLGLAVIGVSVPVLDGELRSRALHLCELQVDLSKDEAQKSFARVMAEEAPQPQPLTAEDERVIQEIAHLIEEFFTSSSDLQPERDDDDKNQVAFVMRSQMVRDQILNDFRRNPVNETFSGNRGHSGPPPTTNGPGPDTPPTPNGGGPGPRKGGPSKTGTSGPGGDRSQSKGGGRSESRGRGQASGAGGDKGERSVPPPPPPPDLRSQFSRNDGGPQSAFGDQVADSLRKGLAGRPRLLDKLKAKFKAYKASFSEPVAPLDLRKFAFAEAVGSAVDNLWQPPNEGIGEVRRIGRAAFKDLAANVYARAERTEGASFQKTVKRVYQTVISRFFSDVAGEESLDAALGHVRDGLPQQPVLTQPETAALREVASELPREDSLFTELAGAYENAPPAMAYNEAELSENQQEAERLRSRGTKNITFGDLTRIDSYEDHYPGRFGSETSTPKARLLADVVSKPKHIPPASPNLLAQSRDFVSLQKSPDVGGILMGRSPESASGDFRDLRWSTDDHTIMLFLRRADGSEIAAGPFEKSLVHQTLAYVADDRKVVVTIINRAADGGRKVILHPAFVDTRLGRDIIVFDKLVFRFVPDAEPHRRQWDRLIGAQLGLYDVAINLRRLNALQTGVNKDVFELTPGLQKELNDLVAREEKFFSDQKRYDLLTPALRDAAGLRRPERSILAWGETFFDSTLVGDISRCVDDSGGDVADFHQCLSSRFSAAAQHASPHTLEEWANASFSIGARSIAEELPYKSDNDLSFLHHENSVNAAESLWPFQFRYEIPFPVKTAVPDAVTRYSKPWEFVELRDLIANKVWAGVQADRELQSVYQHVRDLAVLQRLFRTSLEGKLGAHYPIEKLALLMRATAGSVDTVKTPRCDDMRPDKCR
jgi:hypothetical protein